MERKMFILLGTQGNLRGLMIPNVMMRPKRSDEFCGVHTSTGVVPLLTAPGAGIKGLLLQQDARHNLPALCGLLSGSQSQNLID
jgi:hypothetical protein